MSHTKNKRRIAAVWLASMMVVVIGLRGLPLHGAVPGIIGGTGNTATFALTAQASYISQPDGHAVYAWGYGCSAAPAGFAPFTPSGGCPNMQIPGPTLIVNEGQNVTVTLTNNLPPAAGPTSILFPGFKVTATCLTAPTASTPVPCPQGSLTLEAGTGSTVQYTFSTANLPGTRTYYSGSKSDLQIEMGMYGAVIVRPTAVPAGCRAVAATLPDGQPDYRLAASAYDHPESCYDREYLFQFAEMSFKIHQQAEAQALACPVAPCPEMQVATEPYVPDYFMINGRSMPDLMDPNYAMQYPHQPYNGNPHMHPGELVLLRVIGNGRWQHPFHEHGNHVRILARDGNLILTATNKLAGPLLFTTTTTPGLAMDGIFYWTGKGLNWDVYGHRPGDGSVCNPDPATGYYTSDPTARNYYEWCADHLKPLEAHPFGTVGSGGPVTLPDPNILTNGPWYPGSPYFGPDATIRAVGSTGSTPPSGTVANPPTTEAGFSFMWHSHNEREITTSNIFPGGMLMMMLVDPQSFVIDETQ